jgi:hypothetical protein
LDTFELDVVEYLVRWAVICGAVTLIVAVIVLLR